MMRLTSTDIRCALFASVLQQSDQPSHEAVLAAVNTAIEHLGLGGCFEWMAQEFGDHPETACERMRWIDRLDVSSAG